MAAYTTIDDPSAFFQTVLYTGNGNATNAITNDGNSDLQPDFVWVKRREGASDHVLQDSNRGFTSTTKLASSSTQKENDTSSGGSYGITDPQWGYVSSASSDGFNAHVGTGTGDQVNKTSSTYVAWQWKGAGGTTSTNNDGAVTSTVQVNSTAGFSILTYTMNSNSNETVGHGLGVAPDIVITKARERADSNGFWSFYTTVIDGSLDYLKLNDTTAKANSSLSAPTSTVFTGAGSSTASYRSFVAYCFKSIQGYSKFGTYKGNGNSNGPFIYTGFKPAFFLIKKTSADDGWRLFDNKRAGYNDDNYRLAPNSSDAEDTSTTYLDILSNGVKIRGTAGSFNQSGGTFVYMAFAENPFVTSTGIPTTAR